MTLVTLAVITVIIGKNRIESVRPVIPALLEALAMIQPGAHVEIG